MQLHNSVLEGCPSHPTVAPGQITSGPTLQNAPKRITLGGGHVLVPPLLALLAAPPTPPLDALDAPLAPPLEPAPDPPTFETPKLSGPPPSSKGPASGTRSLRAPQATAYERATKRNAKTR
jgi:hypothetical protein